MSGIAVLLAVVVDRAARCCAVVPVVAGIAGPGRVPTMGMAWLGCSCSRNHLSVCLVTANCTCLVLASLLGFGRRSVDNPVTGGMSGIAVLLAVVVDRAARCRAVVPMVIRIAGPGCVPTVGVTRLGCAFYGQRGGCTENGSACAVLFGENNFNWVGTLSSSPFFIRGYIKAIGNYFHSHIITSRGILIASFAFNLHLCTIGWVPLYIDCERYIIQIHRSACCTLYRQGKFHLFPWSCGDCCRIKGKILHKIAISTCRIIGYCPVTGRIPNQRHVELCGRRKEMERVFRGIGGLDVRVAFYRTSCRYHNIATGSGPANSNCGFAAHFTVDGQCLVCTHNQGPAAKGANRKCSKILDIQFRSTGGRKQRVLGPETGTGV